ncbi:MAG: hypothetical protein IAF38_08050 [Bacteroidia bacterium]|nr:hypothetical protein [Bacteroidia bacterium]
MKKVIAILFICLTVLLSNCELGNSPHAAMTIMPYQPLSAESILNRSDTTQKSITSQEIVAAFNSEDLVAAALKKMERTDAPSKIRASLQTEIQKAGLVQLTFYEGEKRFAVGFLNALYEEYINSYNETNRKKAEDSLKIIEEKILTTEDKLDSLTELAEKDGPQVSMEEWKEKMKIYYKKLAQGKKVEPLPQANVELQEKLMNAKKEIEELRIKKNKIGISKYQNVSPLLIVRPSHFVGGE